MAELRRLAGRLLSSWLLKVIVSGSLLAIILAILPAEQIGAAFRNLPLWIWCAVLTAFLFGHGIAAAKWWLLAARPLGLPLRAALAPHMAGLAANLCLPGVAGGDVVRAGLIMRQVDDRAAVVVGSLGDRLLDTLALLILASIGGLIAFGAPLSTSSLPWLGLVALVLVAGGGLVAFVVPRLLGRLAPKVFAAFDVLRRQPGQLLTNLALSLMVQSLFVALNVVLARASGLDLPAAVWFFAWPLAKLIAIVPVSLAGLGVREASLVGLMAPFGGDPAMIVAVGLLWQSILFATGLIGALATAFVSRSRAASLGQSVPAAER